ncbi:MAG TPA: Ku protein [Steroidobacteraceae bacterium]|jgi:DNA end-binding protein Ku|nr:Ku protein [Steroidobacteraceae bacterium]
MAARSMATLTISFGMVAIPVDLYTTTVSSERISFNLLHAKDGSRVRQQYVCVKEGKVVERSELTKGYEFAKDQYVMFSAEELKALDEVGTNSIDIVEFVPLDSVDPVYFERSYYLAPAKGGARPYALLVAALRDTERCAVGHWASHGRDHMIILRPRGDALVMHQLLFATEVRPIEDIGSLPSEVRDTELKLARQLIDQQAADAFDPSQYVDEVHQRIEAAIRKKVEGHEIALSEPPRPTASNVIDLTAALKASLSGRNEAKLGPRKPAKRVERRTSARKSSRG